MLTADLVIEEDTSALISKYLSDKHIRAASKWIEFLVQHLGRIRQTGGNSTELCELAILHFLNSDIQRSLDTAQCLLLPQARYEEKLAIKGPIILQIVSCEEIGSSLSSQLEALDAYEEKLKPVDRRLVQPRSDEEELDLDSTNRTDNLCSGNHSMDALVPKKMCKLLLEDAAGNRCYALEQKPIPDFRLGMALGGKLLVEDVLLVLGVMMLRPYKCTYLGGSIAEWQRQASFTEIRDSLIRKLGRTRSNADFLSTESEPYLDLRTGTAHPPRAD